MFMGGGNALRLGASRRTLFASPRGPSFGGFPGGQGSPQGNDGRLSCFVCFLGPFHPPSCGGPGFAGPANLFG